LLLEYFLIVAYNARAKGAVMTAGDHQVTRQADGVCFINWRAELAKNGSCNGATARLY
jgi:hypothetical protein